MRKAVPILVLVAVFAGCGGDKPKPTPTPTPEVTATPTLAPDEALAGYSKGVQEYYRGADLAAAEDPGADPEVKYFQPPRPGEAGLGETIRLTGSNIGVQVDVTPTAVKKVKAGGKEYTAVEVEFNNDADGITVLDSEVANAALTYAGGKPRKAVLGVKAPCSNTFDTNVRVDVGLKQKGCVLFPTSDQQPESLQLALETVPTTAGGIWKLG
jgi:hypothetical protein